MSQPAHRLEMQITGASPPLILYLPNGNPAPGPKFDYKLCWLDRLATHARSLLASGEPVVLAGDYNVMPTDLDVYAPERWVDNALFRPEVRDAYRRLVAQGWTDALRALHPDERIYTFWKYFRNAFARNAGLRIDHLLLSPPLAKRLTAAGVDRDVCGPRKGERSCTHLDRACGADEGIAGQGAASENEEVRVTAADCNQALPLNRRTTTMMSSSRPSPPP
jgi:exodeoxyribonuclease III